MSHARAFWENVSGTSYVILVLAATVVIWEVACRLLSIPPFILPTPSASLEELISTPWYFVKQALFTLEMTAAGFALALIIGFVLALAITYSRFLERTLYTLLVALNSVPKVALAPLFVIWLGTGASPKVAIVLTIAIFPIVIDTVLGLRSADPDLLSLARAAGASPLQVLMKIRLPSALPSMFAGMKVAVSLALVGAIVGEFVAGDTGLGQTILLAQGMFQTPRMFVSIIILGVLGTALFYSVDLAERLLIPWHISQRGQHDATHRA
jgi:NitT/TauT family transport system permease protein